jgi:hypothetical protein
MPQLAYIGAGEHLVAVFSLGNDSSRSVNERPVCADLGPAFLRRVLSKRRVGEGLVDVKKAFVARVRMPGSLNFTFTICVTRLRCD